MVCPRCKHKKCLNMWGENTPCICWDCKDQEEELKNYYEGKASE